MYLLYASKEVLILRINVVIVSITDCCIHDCCLLDSEHSDHYINPVYINQYIYINHPSSLRIFFNIFQDIAI